MSEDSYAVVRRMEFVLGGWEDFWRVGGVFDRFLEVKEGLRFVRIDLGEDREGCLG